MVHQRNPPSPLSEDEVRYESFGEFSPNPWWTGREQAHISPWAKKLDAG